MPESQKPIMLATAVTPPAGRSRHPLGPLIERVPVGSGWRVRGYALAITGVALALLGTAIYLKPSPKGYGTHRQLGYPPCGMMVMTGLPCPTCGMTTSFAHTVRGQWWSAIAAQPAGFLLCLLTVLAAGGGLFAAVTGTVYTPNWYRIPPIRTMMIALLILLASWAFKIASVLLDANQAG